MKPFEIYEMQTHDGLHTHAGWYFERTDGLIRGPFNSSVEAFAAAAQEMDLRPESE